MSNTNSSSGGSMFDDKNFPFVRSATLACPAFYVICFFFEEWVEEGWPGWAIVLAATLFIFAAFEAARYIHTKKEDMVLLPIFIVAFFFASAIAPILWAMILFGRKH